MTVKKIKIGQKSFFGAIFDFLGKSDTENSNFAKKFDFCIMFARDTGPQSSKMTKKVKKWTKSHSLIFFMFFGNSTMENTNFNSVLIWGIRI
jgi:hypothetical protein